MATGVEDVAGLAGESLEAKAKGRLTPQRALKPATLPLLLEVGCEEIPARFLRDAEKGLGERVLAALAEARLIVPQGRKSETFSTPRRLVVHVPKILAEQPEKVEELTGPPVKVAVDTNGNYTRAAESFAQKSGGSVAELYRIETPKGEYLALRKTTPGRSAAAILAEILPAAILGLNFPKSMYWTAKSDARFVRPIRWVVALLGVGKNAVTVDYEILGVKSGRHTYGHRALGPKPITVNGFNNYVKKLEQAEVEVDPKIRLERIQRSLKEVVEYYCSKAMEKDELKGQLVRLLIVKDDELQDWVVNSTEWPNAILGSFDILYQSLPREILVTVMRDHQRYFAIENEHGILQSKFIAFLNRGGDPRGVIKSGHERVLRARFADALFFWNADQKRPLRDRTELLEKVTYQVRLGSYADKVRRMRAIAENICATLEAAGRVTPHQKAHVVRAVELCKCDLTAQMVQEFTELQGIVGGLYAKVQGEPEEVATAIYDHYLPAGAEGKSPRTLIGALVSLADKVDAVVGGFVAGLEPTGSRDPFALRRAGNGAVKVLIEYSLPISLLDMAMVLFASLGIDWHGKLDSIADFFEERLKFYLVNTGKFRPDTVNAVLAVGWSNSLDVFNRVSAVEKIRDSDDYVALAAAAKRTRNILRKSASNEDYLKGALKPELFQEEAEIELHKAYASIFDQATEGGIISHDYETILTLTARLRQPIDRFFDQVLVMHEDFDIRKNRLLLLALLDRKVFQRVADLSEINANIDGLH